MTTPVTTTDVAAMLFALGKEQREVLCFVKGCEKHRPHPSVRRPDLLRI